MISRRPLVLAAASLLGFSLAAAQTPAPGAKSPNSHPLYQQLRTIGLGADSVSVSNLVLKRDAGKFTLQSGTLCFFAPVNGKVTGALFSGQGTFVIDPPLELERRNLRVQTESEEFVEHFTELVLRFTDDTYAEAKKAAGETTGVRCSADGVADHIERWRKKLNYNLHGRILQDVLSDGPGGLFLAMIPGKRFTSRLLFLVDPYGVPEIAPDNIPPMNVAPEEVALFSYDENKNGVWGAFHFSHEYAAGTATGTQQNSMVDAEKHVIEASFEKSGKLNGIATTTLKVLAPELWVLPLDLFPKLRVSSVSDASGAPLDFVQEDKDEDGQLFVIFSRPVKRGETFRITTTYSGKDAVFNEGGGNYYPAQRHNWYPTTRFGDYAEYEMTFRVPRHMKMVGTGVLVEEREENGESVSKWRSPVPLAVAGFNFGRFKRKEAKLDKFDYVVESYANEAPPDSVSAVLRLADGALPGQRSLPVALGNLNTTQMLDRALAEAQLATDLFSQYFGPLPYKRLAVSQQAAWGFGQSWPALVYLPVTYFFDSNQRHQLGMNDIALRGFFKTLASHEVAHQWWGHMVGFHSYRDQWISEGFSEMAASLYVQAVYKKPQDFLDFWKDRRETLIEENRYGYRAIDVGPVTMGYRLLTRRTGFDVPQRLIYPKGGYILHMLRMMMWERASGDDRFKKAMREFVAAYANRAASTEDFKAHMEKHITPEMDLKGNGKLDWFFNQYVYGTALPHYAFQHSFERDANGDAVLNFKISQSKVNDDFAMPVPISLELADGRIVFLGRARIYGNSSVEQKVPLRGLKEIPRRATAAWYMDVLSTGIPD